MSQPSPLLVARQRAQALRGAGDLAAAATMLEQAVGYGRSTLGEDDPDVLATLHQLARLHQEADDPAGARRVLEEAYAAGQWRLGDADPLMLEISFDLGVVAEELGNRHEARRAFARVAGTGAEVLGHDHWAVAQARAYLGDEPAPPGAAPVPRTGDGAESARAALTEPTVVQPRIAGPMPAAPAIRQPGQGDPRAQPGGGHAEGRPVQAGTEIAAEPVPRMGAAPAGPPPAGPPAGPAPAFPGTERVTYRRRGIALYAAIAASLAAVIAVVALVVVLAGRDRGGRDVPTLSGAPPTDVKLIDSGSTIAVTWSDPAQGRTTFIVMMGHPGEVLKPAGQVGPGQTSYEIDGLNARLSYCFTVVAVYSTSRFATSPQACTSRPSTR